MRPFIISLLFFLCCFTSGAQLNIDSLKNALHKEKNDSASIMRNLKKVEQIYVTDVKPLLVICDWGLENAKKIKSKYLEAYAHLAKGFAYLFTENSTAEPALHFTDALKISEANNFYDISAQTYNGLAHVYGMGRQTAKFEEFTLKSIAASRKANYLTGISHGYTSLAVTIFEKDKNNQANVIKALDYQRQANTAAESMKDSASLIIYYQNFANYLSQLKQFDSSAWYLQKSKAIIDIRHSGNDNVSYYYQKGNLNFRKELYDDAVRDYLEAIVYSKKYKRASFESRLNHSLYKTYQKMGNDNKALYHLELHKAYQDSALTKENFAKAADIQNKYEREKKDNEINRLTAEQRIRVLQLEKQEAVITGNLLEAQKKENEIALLSQQKELQGLQIAQQDKELEKNMLQARSSAQQIQLAEQDRQLKEKQISNQQQTRNLLLAGLCLLGILSVILLKNIKAKKRAYTELEDKSARIQEQALQLSKQAKLIAQFQSQMNPHFVYNALHNIQGLVLGHETKKANSQIQSLAQLMRKTFANAEKDDIPLEEEISYLQKYIEFERAAFENKLDFEITVDKNAEHVLIPPMMIQPFVENAVKHAELKKVENPYIKVLIEIENNLLAISVKDNGTGIKKDLNEPDKLSHSVSVIKSRLNLIFKGRADVESKPVFSVKTVPEITAGTDIKFYLPLHYSY